MHTYQVKKLRALIPIIISLIIVLNLSSCFLIVTKDKPATNRGKHKGWYKAPHQSTNVIIITPSQGKGNHGDKH